MQPKKQASCRLVSDLNYLKKADDRLLSHILKFKVNHYRLILVIAYIDIKLIIKSDFNG